MSKIKNKYAYHKCAGGVLLCGQNKLFTPLLKKKNGEWVIPKGHIDVGEKTIETAVREIKEELGLKNITGLEKITKLKNISYDFKSNNNIENFKKVYLFAFRAPKKYKLLPFKKEGFIDAKWMEINQALKLAKYKSEREAIRVSIDALIYQITKKKLISVFKKTLKNNLLGIVLTGSLPNNCFKSWWSDVDVLIIVKKINLLTKQKIAQAKNYLEKKEGRHFGIDVIDKLNATNPTLPEISLSGKTLQTLLEAKNCRQNIIYIGKNTKLYYPSKKEVERYSLSNIGILSLKNRRSLAEKKLVNINDFKNAASKETRTANIITKLAIQYFSGYTCKNNKEVLIKSRQLFKNFDFTLLDEIDEAINKWQKLNKFELKIILIKTTNYIEKFSQYVFKKATKIKNN